MRKFYFTNRVVDCWNSLNNSIVTSPNTNLFQSPLDRYWANEDIIYAFRAQIHGTGSRSERVDNY